MKNCEPAEFGPATPRHRDGSALVRRRDRPRPGGRSRVRRCRRGSRQARGPPELAVAGLDHEVRHDPVEDDVVVEAARGERHEVADRDRREVGLERELDRALGGLDRHDRVEPAGGRGGWGGRTARDPAGRATGRGSPTPRTPRAPPPSWIAPLAKPAPAATTTIAMPAIQPVGMPPVRRPRAGDEPPRVRAPPTRWVDGATPGSAAWTGPVGRVSLDRPLLLRRARAVDGSDRSSCGGLQGGGKSMAPERSASPRMTPASPASRSRRTSSRSTTPPATSRSTSNGRRVG